MEEDIKKIKEILEDFMKKYDVTVEVETVYIGRYADGKISDVKAQLFITT